MKKQHWSETPGLAKFVSACQDGWDMAIPKLKKFPTVTSFWYDCNDIDLFYFALPHKQTRYFDVAFDAVLSACHKSGLSAAKQNALLCNFCRSYYSLTESMVPKILKKFPQLA